MISKVILNLLITNIILSLNGWLPMPTCAALHHSPRKTGTKVNLFSNKIQKTLSKEFLLNNSSNILANLIEKNDKNISLLKHAPPTANNTWQLLQTPLENLEIAAVHNVILDENVKTFNDFHYGINKSNQENNLNNNQKQATPLSLSTNNNNNNNNYNNKSKSVNTSILLLTSSPLPQETAPTSISASASASESTNFTSYFERVEMHETLTHTKHEKLLLHRNKRYLLFPEGSSFQLVFDLIIPIVDYTNFAIMGITCAVAWELPNKPPSEIIENFRTKLNDGTFGFSRRNDTVTQQPLEYINRQEAVENDKIWREASALNNKQYLPAYHRHQQLSATIATTNGNENILTNAPANNFYYNSNSNNMQPTATSTRFFYGPHAQQQQQHQWHNFNIKTFKNNQVKTLTRKVPINLYASEHLGYNKWQLQGLYGPKANWWQRNKERLANQWQQSKLKWKNFKENPQIKYETPLFGKRTSRKRKILNKRPKHLIYPIFGKRKRRRRRSANNDDLTKRLQNIHTKEHLKTRQKLYGKIEKLYETRGQNGTACVLRALCETEKIHLNAHQHNEAPQSFVMELLRSIFALPKDTLTNSKESLLHLDDRYTDAVLLAHDVTQSCSQQYGDCEYSISYVV